MIVTDLYNYRACVESLDWEHYDDAFDNLISYKSAFLTAIEQDDVRVLQILKSFYDKAFMIDCNNEQAIKALPITSFLIQQSPYYLDVLLDLLIDNLRCMKKEEGIFPCNTSSLFVFHKQLYDCINDLDLDALLAYYTDNGVIVKKILQLFSFLSSSEKLLFYSQNSPLSNSLFYSFALAFSSFLYSDAKVLDCYKLITQPSSTNPVRMITDALWGITSQHQKEKLINIIEDPWFKISPQYLYWFRRDESLGYWALVAYLHNWKSKQDILFLEQMVKNGTLSFEQEDRQIQTQFDLKDVRQLAKYKSVVYSQHKANQVSECLTFYKLV